MPASRAGDDLRLEAAIAAPKLINAEIEELKAALRYAMLKVGLRAANLPDDEEKAILLAHVLENYGNHTAGEVRLAFDMAISGRLDIDHKNVVCYENFSCVYFSGIMNAYRRWAAPAYKQIVKELPPPPVELTDDEKKYLDIEYWKGLWIMKQKEYRMRLLPPLKIGKIYKFKTKIK